jgi:UDP-N-acetylglucosamine 2-epimerase (non-hydrolysing)
MADILFAPTYRNVKNLRREHVKGKIFMVGNTVVDALNIINKTLPKKSPYPDKYILATVHRRETIGNEMEEIFRVLKKLSEDVVVIVPLHLNPNVQKLAKKVGLFITKPMNYIHFLWYLKYCKYVITDSGGCCEEAPSFGKKVVIVRKKTERGELLDKGYGIIIPLLKYNNILENISYFEDKKIEITHNPFGDGKTVDKIKKIIKQLDGK